MLLFIYIVSLIVLLTPSFIIKTKKTFLNYCIYAVLFTIILSCTHYLVKPQLKEGIENSQFKLKVDGASALSKMFKTVLGNDDSKKDPVIIKVNNRLAENINEEESLPERQPSGQSVSPSGQSISPSGQSVSPSGQSVSPSGQSVSPSGQAISPSGQSISPSGQSISPSGQAFEQVIEEAQKTVQVPINSLPDLSAGESISNIPTQTELVEVSPTLYYFNKTAIRGGRTSIDPTFYYKPNYPGLNDHEFILKCKERLIKNKETEKAFVLVYTVGTNELDKAVFKSHINGAYYKPHTTTGQKIYTIDYVKDIKKSTSQNANQYSGP